jgi:hypothetical protein
MDLNNPLVYKLGISQARTFNQTINLNENNTLH